MPYRTRTPGDRHMSIEEFARLPEEDCRVELVRGRVEREPLPGFEHGSVADELHAALRDFAVRRGLGRVVGHTGFVLFDIPPTVRGPDIAFVAADRIPEQGPPHGFWRGAPDLAVEILSPSNTRRAIREKVADYLEAGARLVWVVDPRARTVAVHRPGAPPALVRDVLDGGDVLQGFGLSVPELFARAGSAPRPRGS